jgi:DNA-directed RNA polymerase specialized sigma24 family protein
VRKDTEPQTTRELANLLCETDWSLIGMAGDADNASSRAMELISRRYWPVVYGYARASGCDGHEASDITQGFMCDVVLGGKLLSTADPARGRFRSLLRAAVRNYVVSQHRKRHGRGARSSAGDSVRSVDQPAACSGELAPEAMFDAQWAAALIGRVLQDVRRHYIEQCQESHWEVFVGRVVRPMLFNEQPTSYDALVQRFDLSDASQASNMMITVKRKFARAMREEVRQTVLEATDVDDELRELMGILERGS